MNNAPHSDARAADAALDGRVDRRTVLRTAAHAAWVVPVIQVVASAPAFAVSGPLVGVSGGAVAEDRKSLTITLTANVTSVTVTLDTFSNAVDTVSVANSVGTWTPSSIAAPRPFVFTGSAANGALSVGLIAIFKPNAKPKSGDTVTISGTVSSGGSSEPLVISATLP